MYEDLTGRKYGMLSVKELRGVVKSRRIWHCICDCGNHKDVREDSLKKYTRSCGCKIKEKAKEKGKGATHGKSHTRLYGIWGGMKTRCYNPHDTGYKYYGERGITVCNEWLNDFEAFYKWAMQNGYADNLTIDRIDVNGNYEPSNCCWATRREQRINQRQKEVTYNNEKHTLLEWADITGIKYDTLLWRYKHNWSADKILSKHDYSEDTKFKSERGNGN